MAGGNFDKFLASFLPKIPKKMYDNIMKSSPALYQIMKQKTPWDSGGDTIKIHLKYKHATNVGSYQGYDTLDITPQDTRTDAEFKLKQLYASIIFNGYENAASSGDLAIFKMADIAASDAEAALKDLFIRLMFLDGTGNSAKDLLGLKAAIDDGTNVGTYGGILRSTYTWWKSQYDGAAAALTVVKMQNIFVKCSRGGMENKPDYIVTDLNQFLKYLALVDGKTTIQQPLGKVGQEFANLGFTQVSFMGVPVVYDEYCPANTMYFLNSNTLSLYTKPGIDFKPTEMVKPANMDAKVGQILWAGELICQEPRANGKMENLT